MKTVTLLSINVGLPREIQWQGKTVTTGIFKDPVEGRVQLRSLNLEGDAQADLTVHGGHDKAVYAYPIEHYDYWRQALPEITFNPGIFSENLTIRGLLEQEVKVGDRFRIGSVELMATQPRLPCYKLGIRFGRADIVKLFLDSQLTGIYFRVLQEGDVAAGDQMERIERASHNVTITDITQLYVARSPDVAALQAAIQVSALPQSWRDYFQNKLDKRER